MSVAKVSEISSTSTVSFDDAVKKGIERAGRTIRNMKGAWVNEQHVDVEDGRVARYRVNLKITFVLDD